MLIDARKSIFFEYSCCFRCLEIINKSLSCCNFSIICFSILYKTNRVDNFGFKLCIIGCCDDINLVCN